MTLTKRFKDKVSVGESGQPALLNLRCTDPAYRHPFFIVNLFAGGGGTSLGLEMGFKTKVSVAVNHNYVAIGVHSLNNRQTQHFICDVYEVDPEEVTQGKEVHLLWASPDCTSFSVAAGGAPIKKNLRMLPTVNLWWLGKVRPRFFIMENVREITTTWGSLVAKRKDGQFEYDKTGQLKLRPRKNSRKRNRRWKNFVRHIERLGYHVEWRVLNCADYGAPTSRERLFLIASRDTRSVPWPEQTHAPANDPRVIAGQLKPHVPVSTCLDLNHHGQSIFERRKPLVEATMRRVALGIIRHFLKEHQPFLVTAQHSGKNFRGQSMDLPMQTIVAANEARGLVGVRSRAETLIAPVIMRQFGNSTAHAITRPLNTTVAGSNKSGLIEAVMEEGAHDHRHLVYELLSSNSKPGELDGQLDHTRREAFYVHEGQRRVITDIWLRMLTSEELKLAQSFPKDYDLSRTIHGKKLSIADQNALIGNSVPPAMAQAFAQAIAPYLLPPSIDTPPEWLARRWEQRGQQAAN